MSIVTIAAVGTAAVLLASLMKGVKAEYGFFLAAAAGMFNVYFATLMKMVGITYIGEFASGICKDSGCSFLGSQIEIFGKLSILAVSAPVVLALLQTLESFLAS